MVPFAVLWLPILLSAVAVFIASFILHMLPGYHTRDFGPVPDEERVMSSLRNAGVSRGEYVLPHAAGMKEMDSPEFRERSIEGPVAFLTVMRSGPPTMSKQLFQWFVYLLVAGALIAYLAALTVTRGTEYMSVFRVVSTAAFLAHGIALWQSSIWYGRKWSTTAKNTLDALVYALLTAGVFAWLWPA